MKLRFYLDPQTGAPHIYNHGVDESEVEDILEMPGEVRIGRDGTRIALGQTESGRYLKVVYRPEIGFGSAFVITAYDLRGNALRSYRRRMRRKHGRR